MESKGLVFMIESYRSLESPRKLRGAASLINKGAMPERQSLSALCGGKAASFIAILGMILLTTFGVSAQQPTATPAPTPTTAEQTINVPAIAPNYRSDKVTLPELGRVGVNMDQQQPLSLRDALKLALENNKDIEVARENVKIAEFDLLGARGAYDPRLSSQSYFERVKTPISSFLSGSANAVVQSDYTGTARLEGLAPNGGGNYRIDFSSIRLNTNNAFAVLNPQYPTALTFTFAQPLARGLRTDNARRQIEILKHNLTLTDVQFRQRAIDTITNVQRAYWDLAFALRNLQVQRDAVRDARAQLEHNKRLVSEGQLAPIDIVAADAQVTGFEQSLYTALEDVSRSENNLKMLIAENRQASIWNSSIIPGDAVDLTAPEISLSEAMKLAIDNRPELQQSNLAREINQVDQKFYRDQTKPQVDLVGSYGMVGLAGTSTGGNGPLASSSIELRDRVNQLSVLNGLQPLPAQPVQSVSPALLGGYPQSFENLLLNRYNNFRVGVSVSLPLRNRTAEGQLGRSLVEGQRLTTQREQLEQAIQVEVRNALQVVRSSEARLRAAAANRAASEQQYESEKRKLDAGQSTVFLVLERQTALTTARGNELRAQTDLNKAIAELQRATGNALTVNSIVVRAH
ncbi:MAG TPA: TolC family protein [Pyrinomonadaceae bacterium]|nr:TolC family protein [Pyrinomonadaceae bacterium]